jgi:hypothetical protein
MATLSSTTDASRPESQDRRPDFVVIGAMKCGTSTLHDQLSANLSLFMSDPKEPNFFSDDAIYEKGLPWYESLFAEATPLQRCGESSTHYTKQPTYPDCAARLAAALPDARLIYVVRDPVDRIVSQYIHEWTQREIESDIDRATREVPHLLAYSRYAMQLRPYLEAYGTDRVLLVFFERMMSAPQEEADRIARFLSIEDGLRWESNRDPRNTSGDRMRKSALRDALVDNALVTSLRHRFVPQRLRDRVKGLWQMSERPRLSARRRGEIARELDPDLGELGGWLGIELDCDNFRSAADRSSGDWSDGARALFPGRR